MSDDNDNGGAKLIHGSRYDPIFAKVIIFIGEVFYRRVNKLFYHKSTFKEC